MNAPKHTPGPCECVILKRNGEPLTSADGDAPCTTISRIALCPLHALAPEMLEALRSIVKNHDSGAFRTVCCDDGPERPANLDLARSIIRKATGE